MTVSEAIDRLTKLREQMGDVPVEADCPACFTSFAVDLVGVGPITARLQEGPLIDPTGTKVRIRPKRQQP